MSELQPPPPFSPGGQLFPGTSGHFIKEYREQEPGISHFFWSVLTLPHPILHPYSRHISPLDHSCNHYSIPYSPIFYFLRERFSYITTTLQVLGWWRGLVWEVGVSPTEERPWSQPLDQGEDLLTRRNMYGLGEVLYQTPLSFLLFT